MKASFDTSGGPVLSPRHSRPPWRRDLALIQLDFPLPLFIVAIASTSIVEVLRRPAESAQYTDAFGKACAKLGISRSMGRVGSALDNAAAESFFSTLEHELLTRRRYAARADARRVVARWIDSFYNRVRRHSSCEMKSPVTYEIEHTSASEHARERVQSDEAA